MAPQAAVFYHAGIGQSLHMHQPRGITMSTHECRKPGSQPRDIDKLARK